MIASNFYEGEEIPEPDLKHLEDDNVRRDGLMKSKPKVFAEEIETKEILVKTKEIIKEPVFVAYNKRALSKYADTYELENFEKNAMVIFNQINVNGYNPRYGTEIDVYNLNKTFKKFNFEIKEHPDLKKETLLDTLDEFTARDFTDYGCVAVVILTHGSDDGKLCAKDEAYYETEIIDRLKCDTRPTLLTKPKLVIIQACRGSKWPKAMFVQQGVGATKMDVVRDKPKPYTLPVEADMLVLHSSYMGYPAHRNEAEGTWLIKTLCSKINELHNETDFQSILTKVQKEVSIDKRHWHKNRLTQRYDITKQMPVVTSTLIREFHFRTFQNPSENKGQEEKKISSLDSESNMDMDAGNFSRATSEVEKCWCRLNHFKYISGCLRNYVADFPSDLTAKKYVDLIDSFKTSEDFLDTKLEMVDIITNFFETISSDISFYKYLHLDTDSTR